MAERELWMRLLRDATQDRVSTPRRIALLCVRTLEVSGAGISLISNTGNRSAVCATDDVSARIEELQVTLGEGPCVDATASRGPVLVHDLTDRRDLAADRWPTFLAAAREAGVRAVFAFPLQIGAIGIGALDLYRKSPGGLNDDQLADALMAAEVASIALLELETDTEVGLVDANAGAYQAQVHQATGMVSVQLDVGIEQAFLLLRARAFSTNRHLGDLCVDIVERRLRFTREDL
jgi:hypothetical protein